MGQVMKMPELQNILERYGKQYKEKHNLPTYVKRTLNAIEKCRTAELGAHEDSETLQKLANDKKYLGAQIGFTSILHTWGQNLKDHPHIHCIVPAGGLDSLGKWRNSKKKFFIPVKVLSKVFRGKFIYYMKQEKLDFPKKIEELNISQEYDNFIQMARL